MSKLDGLSEQARGKLETLFTKFEVSAQRGCCRIEWDGGNDQIGDTTRRECQAAAEELGGSFSWRPGDC